MLLFSLFFQLTLGTHRERNLKSEREGQEQRGAGKKKKKKSSSLEPAAASCSFFSKPKKKKEQLAAATASDADSGLSSPPFLSPVCVNCFKKLKSKKHLPFRAPGQVISLRQRGPNTCFQAPKKSTASAALEIQLFGRSSMS